MRYPSVIIDYSKEPDKTLDNLCEVIYNSLNPNPNFVWQTGVMDSFKNLIDDYVKKLDKAEGKGKADILAKNLVKKDLTDMMRTMATEVNNQANNDIAKLQSSGFTLRKESTKVGVLPKPKNFEVSTGRNSGDILFNVDSHKQAKFYNFYSAPDPAPEDIKEWRLDVSSTHKKNISGFIEGKKYATRTAYKGSSDELTYSDIRYIYVQ